jgi:ribosomal protein S18 acetylase RimI-like enzyme
LIRPATQDDIPGLARVHVQSWLETYSGLVPQEVLDAITLESRVKQWERTFNQPHGLFVALEHNEIVGFASCGAAQDFLQADGELFTLYLLNAFQHRGIGRALWNAVLEFAQVHKWESMVVWVLESNILAQGFYKHQGCKFVDRRVEVLRGLKLPEVAYLFDLVAPRVN